MTINGPGRATARLVPRVDRLTLDEGHVEEVHGEDDAVEMPEDELLRLDDGTPLPVELAELRSLLELHSLAGATDEDDMIAVDDASGRKLLDEIAAARPTRYAIACSASTRASCCCTTSYWITRRCASGWMRCAGASASCQRGAIAMTRPSQS